MPLGAYAPLPLRLGGSDVLGLTAQQQSRLCADLAAVKRTSALCHIEIQSGTVVTYRGMNGSGAAVADVSPTVSGWIITLEPLWVDPYEYEHPVRIRHVVATHRGVGSNYRVINVTVDSANVVTLRKGTHTNSTVTTENIGVWIW